ncbi:MAG: mechanosensitive ion channel [Desulfobacterales bacterium]|nr:mechanosensitive ion channel [Desulfobacterales bacterium]
MPEKLPVEVLISLFLLLCPGSAFHCQPRAEPAGAIRAQSREAVNPGSSEADTVWEELIQAGEDTIEVMEETFGSLPDALTLAKRLGISLLLLFAVYLLWRAVKRYLLPRVRSGWPVRILSVFMLGCGAVMGILSAWGADVYILLTTPPGKSVFGSFATILFVVIGAYIVWEFINYLLYRHIMAMNLGEALEKRLQTVLPLARSALFTVICIITLLVILSELGLNIAPMLAGAGIVGLAIGFGAQSLVKDLLTGFFVLLENTINVGDWVLLGGHDGQVENLTIRHVTVRDIYGNLHTVPWSSVVTITNQTRDFGYAVVEVGFAYRENVDEVVAVVQQIADEMRREPEINEGILSELQILGLIELGDSAVVVRTRFKTLPFMRWRLERDFRRRIKNRFDELGIEIPYPHQTVYFGENKQGQAPPARIQIQKLADSEPDQGTNGSET